MQQPNGEVSGNSNEWAPVARRFGWWHIAAFVAAAVAVSVGITVWGFQSGLFQSEFRPVSLNPDEQRALEEKLDRLQGAAAPQNDGGSAEQGGEPLAPEPFSELGAKRKVAFTERELNAMLAHNTDLARRVAIDLSEGLVSARIVLPLEEDFPVLGGKTLRVRAGAEFAYLNDRAIVKLRGVSVMGVPLPNAWLGGLKNIDLVREFGASPGFWKAFSDGIEDVRVGEGTLELRFRE
jgi:hypothetical protein